LREVICPVLELREEKRTFVKVGGGKVDFFPFFEYSCSTTANRGLVDFFFFENLKLY
jgi:hypothetical protein